MTKQDQHIENNIEENNEAKVQKISLNPKLEVSVFLWCIFV